MSTRTVYVCQACGHNSAKWLGRCPGCGDWNTLAEEVVERGKRRPGARRTGARVAPLKELGSQEPTRFSSGVDVLDRVLGGGVVAGGTSILAGEPGIGKSTLLLQLGDALGEQGRRVLYVSAEESARQLRMRGERLGCSTDQLLVAAETHLEAILAAAESEAPSVLLVDSIQALRSAELESPPGSIGQVRHAADRLVSLAKARHTALFLIGHVTKEGAIAGPKSLEHLVDTVLSFEGEHESGYRLLRATKNRFGPTGEVALFEMRDDGLSPVRDPSRVLLARRRSNAPGSAVLATVQGSRPLLVEVQALANVTSFPSPRRMSLGLDVNRVILLVAVLERFAGYSLAQRDLFINVVGGLSLREPASDLAVLASLVSAVRDTALPEDAVFFGEVGLLGEVRPVAKTESRLREAAHLGFRRAYLPAADEVDGPDSVTLVPVHDLADLIRELAPS